MRKNKHLSIHFPNYSHSPYSKTRSPSPLLTSKLPQAVNKQFPTKTKQQSPVKKLASTLELNKSLEGLLRKKDYSEKVI